MKLRRDVFKFTRVYKTIVIYVLVALAFAVFLILYLNQDLRNYIFSDMRLFTLSILLWLVLIVSFVTSLFDFWTLQQMTQIGHNLNQIAYLDKLTGIPNRYSCDMIFQSMDTPDKVAHVGGCLFSIKNLIEVNEKNGHDAGDHLITVFSSILDSVGSKYGFVGRNSGNEFLLIIENCSRETVDKFLTSFRKRIDNYNKLNEETPLKISFARQLNEDVQAEHFAQFVTRLYDTFHKEPEEL